MINLAYDSAKVTALKAKFEKYGPYAIKRGLQAANEYLNTPAFKQSMYPGPVRYPFVWSSERQRRAFFATDGFGAGIPYVRTNTLANSAQFNVNERSFWIEYKNSAPYAKWVHHPSYQIIGHKTTGWKPAQKFTFAASGKIVPLFKKGALAAWKEMDAFMYGGGAGL